MSLPEASSKFDKWDTAGQERYHSLAPMYYRGAAAACAHCLRRFKHGNPNLVMALVGNKCDLEPSREVNSQEENGMFFIETSAKNALNVNQLFYEMAKRLAKAIPLKPAGIRVQDTTQNQRSSFCCS